MIVPLSLFNASAIRSNDVIAAGLPVADTNRRAASILGPILPLANSPAAASRSTSASETGPIGRASGVPQPTTAFDGPAAPALRWRASETASGVLVI